MLKLRDYQQKAVKECWEALRKNNEPVLLMASVGAGKSLMIGDILLTIEKHGKRALCLVDNSELVRNNYETYNKIGGNATLYCAALKQKNCQGPIVFGSPATIVNAIKKQRLKNNAFNMIVIDEAHRINYKNNASTYMKIITHFQNQYSELRILGATGTNFRYKGEEIVGEDKFFKTQVGNITTEQLIDTGYLIEPNFEIDTKNSLDFSHLKVNAKGQFENKELQNVVNVNHELTKQICMQIMSIVEKQKRFGVFIFASTKSHAKEILSYLPAHQSALILGETESGARSAIIDSARHGLIKYIVNISIVSVGIDIPPFDTVAYLRPTESLVLMVQTMGRALRLSPNTHKKNALILDYAGNLERHADWDNPLIINAIKKINKDLEEFVECPACGTANSTFSRRCIHVKNGKRCKHYFVFKKCEWCFFKNDVTARECRNCSAELINPDDKLNLLNSNPYITLYVEKANFRLTGNENKFGVLATYFCKMEGVNAPVTEYYATHTEKARNYFYANFVKKHLQHPSHYYRHLDEYASIAAMLKHIKCPAKLVVTIKQKQIKIKKRIFYESKEAA